MDAFEAVRRRAEALHDEAVARGGDAWSPWSLAQSASALLGCELYTVPSGDALLRGGAGFYDPITNLIAVEHLADEAMRGLLASHELGHVVVHRPSEFVVTTAIHPERVPEPSSAVEKLVDYGEREKREVQMDLFAREFVLPRKRARALYADEGLSARAIAARSGLPFAVVAQQIFDAALLPPVSEAEQARPFVTEENDTQTRAVEHRESPFLLEAGPGSGKTRTLIQRIERLLDEGADPSTILVLTFSNKAAGELRTRLTARRSDAAAVWIGTFHAFGYDVLKRFGERINLPPDPKLIDRVDTVAIIEQVLPKLSLRHYRNIYDPTLDIADFLRAISRAKDEVVDAATYRDLARQMHDRAVAAGDKEAILEGEKVLDVASVYAAYETLLDGTKQLDFGDLIMRPVVLAEQDPEVVAALRERHHHVLVDEYQDVNRASVRLLKAVAGTGENLWAVGDARQSIYRFRGASSANMGLFATDFPGGASESLDVNYRSCSEVVDLFTTFSTSMLASSTPLALDAKKGRSGCEAELRRTDLRTDEGSAVAAAILELQQSGVAFRDQAVLCRGNKRLAEIAGALEAREIPVLYLGSMFERSEIKDLLALLALLADPRAGTLPRVAAMERYRLSLQQVADLLAAASDAEEPMAWTRLEGWTADAGALSRVQRLSEDLGGFREDSNPWWVAATYLLDRTSEVRRLAASGTVRDRIVGVALWQFLTFCASLQPGRGRPIAALLERVTRLVLLSEERDLRQMPAAADTMDAVRLMTVHGAKGLEFEAVHVPGLNVSSFPISSHGVRCRPPDGMIFGSEGLTGKEAIRRGHEEEEECLFFVALSRAKQHVRLYAAKRQDNGNNRNPSKFLERIKTKILSLDPAPLHMPHLETASEAIAVNGLEEIILSEAQLQLFSKCPRRFFYTHLLGVPGARRSTAFVRMHDAVYNVIAWLKHDPEGRKAGIEATRERFAGAWDEHGPTGDPNADVLKAIGGGLIDFLIESREGSEQLEVARIRLEFGSLRIDVAPDEIRRSADGLSLRRVRTGKKSADEFDDDITYALYILAARAGFENAVVEAVHLTDRTVQAVPMTPRKLANREEKLVGFGKAIGRGEFPAVTDSPERTCPRCPHFVICEAVPDGPLSVGS